MNSCLNCSKEAKVKFCSISCAASYNNKQNPKVKPQGKCAVCQTAIHRRNKFCSKECQMTFNQMNPPTHKKCNTCNLVLPLEDFYGHNKYKVAFRCKKCANQNSIKQESLTKEKFVNYKGGQCTICGYSKCIGALEFHHLDPAEKEFTMAKMKNHKRKWEDCKKELDKCILVCGNCHPEIHAGLHPQHLK